MTPARLGGLAGGLALAAAAVPVATGCGAGASGVELVPDFELDGAGENVDSIAFFEPPDPAQTLLFVTAKGNQRVEVWRHPFASSEQAPLEHPSFGTGTQVNGIAVDQELRRLYIAVSAPTSTVAVFSLPDLVFQGELARGALDLGSEPNLALLRRPDGARWLYVSSDREILVLDAKSGAEIARFTPATGLETMVADDREQVVYVPDENGGSGVHAYEPLGAPRQGGGPNPLGPGLFDEDAEGIVLYRCAPDAANDDGEGLLVVADQRGDQTEFEVFDRRSGRHQGAFRLAGVANTDGIASTQRPLPGWPQGVFAAIDDDTSTAVIGWDRILAATGLGCPAREGAARRRRQAARARSRCTRASAAGPAFTSAAAP